MDGCLLTISLERNGLIVYEDSKTVQEPKDLKLPIPKIKTDIKKAGDRTFEISLESAVYAKAVKLDMGGLDGRFEDNFFDLIPNRQKIVKCKLKDNVSLNKFQEAFKCQSYPYT